jgi:hypothetical protein
MVSRDFLEKRADARVSIPVPAAMPEAGWYPTAYSIRHDERLDAYFVTLESFRRFGASSGSRGQSLAAADGNSGTGEQSAIGDSPEKYRIF